MYQAPILAVATKRDRSGVALMNELPPDLEGPEAITWCSWWRRREILKE